MKILINYFRLQMFCNLGQLHQLLLIFNQIGFLRSFFSEKKWRYGKCRKHYANEDEKQNNISNRV